MTALSIMIINENQSVVRWQKTPALTKAFEVHQWSISIKRFADLHSEFKLCHCSKSAVFTLRDSFTTHVDHLLINIGACVAREPVISVEISKTRVDHAKIFRPHVFSSVNSIKRITKFIAEYCEKNSIIIIEEKINNDNSPETSDSSLDSRVQEINNFAPYVFRFLIQIVKTQQLALSYFMRIFIIINCAH